MSTIEETKPEQVSNDTNDDQKNKFHPIEILVDAVEMAQRRGAFQLSEAEIIAHAVRVTRENVPNLRSPFIKMQQNQLQQSGNDSESSAAAPAAESAAAPAAESAESAAAPAAAPAPAAETITENTETDVTNKGL